MAQLESHDDRQLDAAYVSPLADRVDVENILLYNVGVGAFRIVGQHGLSLERVVGEVPSPPVTLDAPRHYHRYAIAPAAAGWHAWRVASDIAGIGPTPIPPLTAVSKVSGVWCALKRWPIRLLATPGVGASFGLELDLVSPIRRASLAMFVKPLVDAVMAALHVHIEPLDPAVTTRHPAQVGASEEEIGRLLMRNDAAALGARRLTWPWRTGVQWNPADDRIVALRLRSVTGSAGSAHLDHRLCGHPPPRAHPRAKRDNGRHTRLRGRPDGDDRHSRRKGAGGHVTTGQAPAAAGQGSG